MVVVFKRGACFVNKHLFYKPQGGPVYENNTSIQKQYLFRKQAPLLQTAGGPVYKNCASIQKQYLFRKQAPLLQTAGGPCLRKGRFYSKAVSVS